MLVQAPVEPAFAVFTAALETWWPPEYTWSGDALVSIGIQPGPGGRCYERDRYGFERHWGQVLVCDPLRRLRRHGPPGIAYRAAFGSPVGQPYILTRDAGAAAAP